MNGNKSVRSYRDLIAWQKAMDLVEMVYAATQSWPKEELYGLTSQIRRAVVSIPSNIAEGQGRRSDRDFSRYLSIAYGSLREVETQILIAERLGYAGEPEVSKIMEMSAEVGKLVNGLANSLTKQ